MKRRIPRRCMAYVLAALGFSRIAFASDAPEVRDCRLKQLASIGLDIGIYVLVPVNLDGTPARMGLSTAAAVSSISKARCGRDGAWDHSKRPRRSLAPTEW